MLCGVGRRVGKNGGAGTEKFFLIHKCIRSLRMGRDSEAWPECFPARGGAGLSWRRSQLDCIIFLMGGARSLVEKGEA